MQAQRQQLEDRLRTMAAEKNQLLEKSNQKCSSLENSKRLLEGNLRKVTSDLRSIEQQNTMLQQKVHI